MRSQPSRALTAALLSISGVALVACDSNMVGGFEDGGGGSGGGEDVSASTGDAASTGADSTSSTAATSSTSTGGVDPDDLPNAGQLWVRQVDVGSNTDWAADGYFVTGRPFEGLCTNDDGTPLTDLTVGSCAIQRCLNLDYPPAPTLSAGQITVSGTSQAVNMSIDPDSQSYSDDGGDGEIFGQGAVTFLASGDVVPAFSGSVSPPPPIENLSLHEDDGAFVDVGQDLTVTWDATTSASASLLVFLPRGSTAIDNNPNLLCLFDVQAEQGVIPYALLAANPELRPTSGVAFALNTSVVAAGDFRVSLSAYRYIGGNVTWEPPALVCDSGLFVTGTAAEDVYGASTCLSVNCCDVVSACADADPEGCPACLSDGESSPLCDPVLSCIEEHCADEFPLLD
jgi:hypothetical protein